MTRHTTAPDKNIKERVPRNLNVETRNDVKILYQWVQQNGLNLGYMWKPGKSGTAIILSPFSRRTRSIKTGHRKDNETIEGDRMCGPQISKWQTKMS